MQKNTKIYLMIAGTLFPAFAFVTLHQGILEWMEYKALKDKTSLSSIKERLSKFSEHDVIIFSVTAILGGYLTSQMLKNL